LEVKIYYWKSTFGSQNILSEVDFRKSKYITESQPPEVKIYYRKSTFGSQNTLSNDLRNSKIITGSRIPKVKNMLSESTVKKKITRSQLPKVIIYYRKLTHGSQKINSILNIFSFI